jgi:hypothetical protein
MWIDGLYCTSHKIGKIGGWFTIALLALNKKHINDNDNNTHNHHHFHSFSIYVHAHLKR